MNKFIVNDFSGTIFKELDLLNKPNLIYNMDDEGCQFNMHKDPYVFVQKGVKNVYFVAPKHGKKVTVVLCGNTMD